MSVDTEAKNIELNNIRRKIYEKILTQAKNSDLEAGNDIGYIMYSVIDDKKKAVEIFMHNAIQGSRRGKLGVALALFSGHGIKQDYQRAYKIFAELADENEKIKDFCIAWSAFSFPRKFIKSIRSKENCEKGARFVTEAYRSIRDDWESSCWTDNIIDYSEADIECCRNELSNKEVAEPEVDTCQEEIDLSEPLGEKELANMLLNMYPKSDREILHDREQELNKFKSGRRAKC